MGDDVVELVEGACIDQRLVLSVSAPRGGTVWTHQESVARSLQLDRLSFELAHEPVHHELRHRRLPTTGRPRRAGGHPVRRMVLRRCAAARGITGQSRSPTRAAGARWVVRPQSRRSSGLRMVGRTSSAVMAANGMCGGAEGRDRGSRAASRDQHDEFDADGARSRPGTRCVAVRRRWARSAAAMKLIGRGCCNTFDLSLVAAAGRRSISTPRPAVAFDPKT